MAVDTVRDLAVRRAEASPLVLRMAPLDRSRTRLALTPGLRVSLPSFSSRESWPFVCWDHQWNPERGTAATWSVPRLCQSWPR